MRNGAQIDNPSATRDRHTMIVTLLQVGIGGAIGSVLRFSMGLAFMRAAGGSFPFAMMPVNILGSFLMGVLFVVLTHRDMMQVGPLLMTGVLGGFTTFSAFSLETYVLYERGEVGLAAFYVFGSVVLSVLGLALGCRRVGGLRRWRRNRSGERTRGGSSGARSGARSPSGAP